MMAKVLLFIASIVILAGCSTLPDKSPSTGTLFFSSTPESSKKIIVFVHGVFGDSTNSWTNQAGVSWPDLIKGDDRLHDFTVAIFRYDTPFLSRSSTIEEISTRLLRRLEDEGVFRNYSEIYFVAHSMGGLVTKRTLIDLNRQSQIEKLKTVKAVLFISTPSLGANLAEFGSWISANPQLRDMEPADLNTFLQGLENQWQDLLRDRHGSHFPKAFCAYETKPYYGVVAVNRIYSTTFCDQNPFPVDDDHLNIAKPANRESDIYVWVRARILETSAIAQSRKLEYFLKKTPYNYREYEFVVKNLSKTHQIVDLRINFALPWPVIGSRLISAQGCQDVTLAGIQDPSFKLGNDTQITKLQDSWTNVLNIDAIAMFPEAEIRGKVIMMTDSAPLDSPSLKAAYRHGNETTKNFSYHKISVLDVAAGIVKIDPDPLKGEQSTSILFMPKEQLVFPGKTLSLDCTPVNLPVRGKNPDSLYSIYLHPDAVDNQLPKYMFGEGADQESWPNSNSRGLAYKCDLASNTIPLLAINIAFVIDFGPESETRQHRTLKVPIPPLRDHKSFVFYMANCTAWAPRVFLPETAIVRMPGEAKERTISIESLVRGLGGFGKFSNATNQFAMFCGMRP
jgi:pimeloyl-ACP methyl ester carboxylesterase